MHVEVPKRLSSRDFLQSTYYDLPEGDRKGPGTLPSNEVACIGFKHKDTLRSLHFSQAKPRHYHHPAGWSESALYEETNRVKVRDEPEEWNLPPDLGGESSPVQWCSKHATGGVRREKKTITIG